MLPRAPGVLSSPPREKGPKGQSRQGLTGSKGEARETEFKYKQDSFKKFEVYGEKFKGFRETPPNRENNLKVKLLKGIKGLKFKLTPLTESPKISISLLATGPEETVQRHSC